MGAFAARRGEGVPRDLALVDVHASLAQEAGSSLWLLAAVKAKEVHVGRLLRHLEVADGAVTLVH